jgi:ABC-type phosphate transport system permease subunit
MRQRAKAGGIRKVSFTKTLLRRIERMMHILVPIASDVDLALAAMAFFAAGLILGYIVLPLYASVTRDA